MTSCTGIEVMDFTPTRINLKGSITGLAPGDQYCLLYLANGEWWNVARGSLDYTYISGATNFSMSGCWLPRVKLQNAETVDLRFWKVLGNCETRVSLACRKTLNIKETQSVLIDVEVEDQERNPVAGVDVTISQARGAKTISTDFRGVARGFTLPLGTHLKATVTHTPFNYKTSSASTKSVYVNQSGKISIGVTKIVTRVCTNGQKRYPTKCEDGTTIYKEVCENGQWAPTHAKCEMAKGEGAIITDVRYPLTAKAGDDVEVIVTAKNIGDETCELRGVLRNYEGKKIDTMPEERLKLFTSVTPGASKDFKLSTSHDIYGSRWKMPEYDWDIEVEIAEIDKNWGSVQKVHDSRRITIQLYHKGEEYEEDAPWEDTDPHRGEDDDYADDDVSPTGDSALYLDAPSVMVSGKTTVTGVAPSSNTKVEIMGVRKFIGFDMLSRDATLATTMSDAEGNYSVPIELGEFGVVDVYAKIRRDWKPPGWLGSIIPPIDWLARDTTSAKQTIFVLTYTILFAILAMLAMVLDKKYGFIGIFGKKGGKK